MHLFSVFPYLTLAFFSLWLWTLQRMFVYILTWCMDFEYNTYSALTPVVYVILSFQENTN